MAASDDSCEPALWPQLALVIKALQEGVVSIENVDRWVNGEPFVLPKRAYTSLQYGLAQGLVRLFANESLDRRTFAEDFAKWKLRSNFNRQTQELAARETKPILAPKLIESIDLRDLSMRHLTSIVDRSGQVWILATGMELDNGSAHLYRVGTPEPIQTYTLTFSRRERAILLGDLRLNSKGEVLVHVMKAGQYGIRHLKGSAKSPVLRTLQWYKDSDPPQITSWERIGNREWLTGAWITGGMKLKRSLVIMGLEETQSYPTSDFRIWDGPDGSLRELVNTDDRHSWAVTSVKEPTKFLDSATLGSVLGQDGSRFIFHSLISRKDPRLILWDSHSPMASARSVSVPGMTLSTLPPRFYSNEKGQRVGVFFSPGQRTLMNLETTETDILKIDLSDLTSDQANRINYAFQILGRPYLGALAERFSPGKVNSYIVFRDLSTFLPIAEIPIEFAPGLFSWIDSRDRKMLLFGAGRENSKILIYDLLAR